MMHGRIKNRRKKSFSVGSELLFWATKTESVAIDRGIGDMAKYIFLHSYKVKVSRDAYNTTRVHFGQIGVYVRTHVIYGTS